MTITDPRDAEILLNDTIFSQFSMSHHCGASNGIFRYVDSMPRLVFSHAGGSMSSYNQRYHRVSSLSVHFGWSWTGQRVRAGPSLQHCITVIVIFGVCFYSGALR